VLFGSPLASPARRPAVIRSFRPDPPGRPAPDVGAALPVTLGVIAAALALLVPAGVRGVPERSPRVSDTAVHATDHAAATVGVRLRVTSPPPG